MDTAAVAFALAPMLTFVALAMIVGFAVFMTGFRLAARAREATAEGRAGWLLLASTATGCGSWACGSLIVAGASGGPGFHADLLLAGLVAAVLSAMGAFVLTGRRLSLPRSLVAGALTAFGVVSVPVIGLFSLAGVRAVGLSGPTIVTIGVILAVIAAAAHRRAGLRDRDRPIGLASLMMAVAAVLSSLVIVLSAELPSAAFRSGNGDVIGQWALTSTVAVVVFLVVATGMATALIHRDAQFTSQQRLKRLADASVEGLAILDGNSIVEVNETLVALTGRSRDQLRGSSFAGGLMSGDDLEPVGADRRVREAYITGGDGRAIPVEIIARPLDYDGRPHTVYAIRDMSDRRDAELRIRFLAEHDVLTGLPNRAAFQQRLETACAEGVDGDHSFALFCIDLDRFKEANDVFGHRAGDEVLIQTGERLRALLPPAGFVARLGGDEFVLLVPDLAVPHGVGDLAQQIVEALADPFVHEGGRIGIGASVGVAVAPTDGKSSDLILARADMALFRAKQQGRGTFCFFEVAMDEETRLRRALAFELRDAIANGDLELAYQPLADLTSSGITGFEALVRWRHPVHGSIAPAIFVAIAEEGGFITQLGEWVLRTAAAEAAGWQQPLTIAVNLSPLQLEHQNLPETVHEILLRTGLSPSRLELEVTEAALMRNPQRALDVLRRLKGMGVRIAMDDFGTGYSSLSTLQSFPFDKLKIDRSFVDRVGTHSQAASIVRAVVGLSRSLDIRVVAEGVETEAQIAFLADEACDEIQGFFIGLPLPIEEYAHLTRPGLSPPPANGPDPRARAA